MLDDRINARAMLRPNEEFVDAIRRDPTELTSIDVY